MNVIKEFVVTVLGVVVLLMVIGFGVLLAENLIKAYDKKHYQERHCTLDQSAVGPTLYCN